MTHKRFSIREATLPFEVRKVSPLTFFPVTDILSPENPTNALKREALLFSYKSALKTLEVCLKGQYLELDGLTMTNCCHGISLLTRSILLQINQLDLKSDLKEGENQIRILKTNPSLTECTWFLPRQLIDLSRLYILSRIKEADPIRRWTTIFENLKQISSIGTKLCRRTATNLQTYISNKMAESYYSHFQNLNEKMEISGAPVEMWGKYLHPDFIRTDRRGRKYAPCIFSMQISLAHLIQSRATIALVNDLRSTEGKFKGRYVKLLRGDGLSQFVPIGSPETMGGYDERTPVVVFGGCSYSDDLSVESFEFLISPWLSRFSQLVLACDIKYPQFPAVRDDPNFDSTPIVPEEERLRKIIALHREIPGVCAHDASFFCLAHIYTASMKQVVSVLKKGEEEGALPYSFIPEIAKSPHL